MVVDASVVASDAVGSAPVAALVSAASPVGLASGDQEPRGEQRNQQYSEHGVLLSSYLNMHIILHAYYTTR